MPISVILYFLRPLRKTIAKKHRMRQKNTFLFLTALLFSQLLVAEPLHITLEYKNKSDKLHDGYAKVTASGGQAPYQYKWSNKSTRLVSNTAEGLVEGRMYEVVVSDATGNVVAKEFKIPVQNFGERINHFFHYMVKATSSVLMADVFAILELYDPTLYDENGQMLVHPNGDPQKMSIPFIVVWLIIGAIFFTFKLKFINIIGFKHAIHLVQGKYDNPRDKGEISHFQALTTALSATVGLGNIAGVAIALSLGGPGAVFWMIIAGVLGMSTKFAEATLGVQFRRINKNGSVSGGPMYYLKYAFGMSKIGKKTGHFVAVLFALLLIGGSYGAGNMFQANQTFSQLSMMIPQFQGHGFAVGVALSVLVGMVIIGGIRTIARVTSKIVPFMALFYISTALVIIAMNITHTGEVVSLIFNGAFCAPALKGGFVGVMIMGIRRATFSNEAGIGSAAIAHSAVKTHEPVSEGIVALLGPFIDTVLICTLTAFVLLFTGYYNPADHGGLQGSQLTSAAFGSVFWIFPWFLLIAIFLFSFSTMISWSYYGLKGFDFLFGKYSEKLFGSRTISDTMYKLSFLAFIVIGSSSNLGSVIDFADMMILGMALPNIFGLYIFAPKIKRNLASYLRKLETGKIKRYK